MKRILFALVLLTAGKAFAIENVYRPYLGIDYIYTKSDAKNINTYFNSAALVIGSEYNKYFSTEVFYNKSFLKTQQTTQGKMKSSFWGYGLDMYAYLPLGCAQQISPYATLGIGKYALKRKVEAISHNDKDGTGYRLGLGLNYRINSNLSLRGGFRYIHFDRLANIDHANEFALGMRYAF